jgi:hypothetical protein
MAWPDLLARAEAIFRPGADDVTPDWLTLSATEAIAASKTDVQQALAGRGFSPAQIDAWAGGPGKPLVLQIALFYVATDSRLDIKDAEDMRLAPLPGPTGSGGRQGPAVLDRRHELRGITITDDAGNLILPALDPLNPAANPIGSGRMTRADSVFTDRFTGKFRAW